jgi:hypothetical protein
MKARIGQSARPYNRAHGKVFTNIFVSAPMPSFARFCSYGHSTVGFLVGGRISLLFVFSDSGRHDEGHGQKRLESKGFCCSVNKMHFLSIPAVVTTMMYDSSVLSSPPYIANTFFLCLRRMYLLIMLPKAAL